MPDPLDLSRAPRIADMINAWFCPQCGLRDETMRGIDQDGTCSSCGSDCCTWDSVRGHLAHYGWEVVSADDARELSRIRAEATAPRWPTAEEVTAKALAEGNFIPSSPVLCHPTDPCVHGITGPCSKCQQVCDRLGIDVPAWAAEIRAKVDSAQTAPRTTALLCYEGDCAKMTGRARPCPVHDAPAQTAEHDYVDPMLSGYAAQTAEVLRSAARQVLEALANATIERLSNGWEMLDGDSNRAVSAAELARRAARKEKP